MNEEKSFHLEALIQKILGKRASQETFLGFSGFKKTEASQSEVTPATGSGLQCSIFKMCVQIGMCTGSRRFEDSQGLVLQLQASWPVLKARQAKAHMLFEGSTIGGCHL